MDQLRGKTSRKREQHVQYGGHSRNGEKARVTGEEWLEAYWAS